MMDEKRIRAAPCSKFVGEELLYLFYGKPAYRPGSIDEGKRFASHFPVCFLIKLDDSISLKRIFPFDSGAFPQRYAKYIHSKMSLADFEMPPNSTSARTIVEGFFESNDAYFNSEPLAKSKADQTMETKAYLELVRSFQGGGEMDGDDRLMSIEMQAEGEITIQESQIRAIIIPDRALELDDVRDTVASCRVPIFTYITGPVSARECFVSIYNLVRDIQGLK